MLRWVFPLNGINRKRYNARFTLVFAHWEALHRRATSYCSATIQNMTSFVEIECFSDQNQNTQTRQEFSQVDNCIRFSYINHVSTYTHLEVFCQIFSLVLFHLGLVYSKVTVPIEDGGGYETLRWRFCRWRSTNWNSDPWSCENPPTGSSQDYKTPQGLSVIEIGNRIPPFSITISKYV